MSGEVPRLDFNFSDFDHFQDEQISPLDLTTLTVSDDFKFLEESQNPSQTKYAFLEPVEVVSKFPTENPTTDLQVSVLAPEPLLPDKFHPLGYCYKLPEDYDNQIPRLYINGIPNDEDIVIYSEIDGNVTWAELKAAKPDTPNLHRVYPLLQWDQHNADEKHLQNELEAEELKVKQTIEEIRTETRNEKLRLDRLFPKPIVKPIEPPKPQAKSPSLVRKEHVAVKRVNTQIISNSINRATNATPRVRPNVKQNSIIVDTKRQKNLVKNLNKSASLSEDNLRHRKVKPIMPFFTQEEHEFYETFGCTKKEMQERKAQEKRMKAGVRF
eukprot:TRINITY_DN22289_c0_g1_i1.p1 TRINITY_DN22289_c0_g1~~TRINITY_DN22289_c0_g1_i1.p1  ORF type:complete len:326 (-),score=32.67 TRINITY_DN22289_c0_g1_i1:10-987(-)